MYRKRGSVVAVQRTSRLAIKEMQEGYAKPTAARRSPVDDFYNPEQARSVSL
jgi:hypothetical protein